MEWNLSKSDVTELIRFHREHSAKEEATGLIVRQFEERFNVVRVSDGEVVDSFANRDDAQRFADRINTTPAYWCDACELEFEDAGDLAAHCRDEHDAELYEY